MSKATAAAVLSVAKKASSSRKRHAGDEEGVDFEESIESTIEYGPTPDQRRVQDQEQEVL